MGLSEAVQQKIYTKRVPASWWHQNGRALDGEAGVIQNGEDH